MQDRKTLIISFNQPHFGLVFMKKSFQNYEWLRIYFPYLLPAKFAAQHCRVFNGFDEQAFLQRIIGANTIVQGALPSILKNTPKAFYQETLKTIESNAKIAYNKLTAVPGFRPGSN